MAAASPAGASTTPAANHLIIGSGSSTTYYLMSAMDTLFNQSLGCYMTQPSGTTQTLDFSCAKVNNGLQTGQSYTANPINDIAVSEPALGSSAGISQVEDQGSAASTPSSASINYGRSSRALKTTDSTGLNFVSYAADGVSWLSFPEVNGKPTVSANVKTLTVGDLTDIWNGTYKKWNQIPGTPDFKKAADNLPICVYNANLSSGTTSTWASALGFASPTALNAYGDSITTTPAGCKSPAGLKYNQSHTALPENEAEDVVKNGDEADSIFFMSYGKYQVVCAPHRTGFCDDNLPATGTKATKVYLGEVNGVAPTVNSILCLSSKTCQAAFPIPRQIFNVYSNGSNSAIPAATTATLNYVSEIGYICKPEINTKGGHIIDPNSGLWYHQEVNNVITAQGFIPWPLQNHEDQGTIDTPASAVLKAAKDKTYSPNDPIVGNGTARNEAIADPAGYCKVYTTDTAA
jgi:ABC-type phosphate transport system substrate-binding protein